MLNNRQWLNPFHFRTGNITGYTAGVYDIVTFVIFIALVFLYTMLLVAFVSLVMDWTMFRLILILAVTVYVPNAYVYLTKQNK